MSVAPVQHGDGTTTRAYGPCVTAYMGMGGPAPSPPTSRVPRPYYGEPEQPPQPTAQSNVELIGVGVLRRCLAEILPELLTTDWLMALLVRLGQHCPDDLLNLFNAVEGRQ